MDERQTKIVEGAGLEESRINEELIAFLNKWSFPVLLVIALVSGAYYAKNMYDKNRIIKRDNAFAELGAVESSQTPSVYSLTEIANQFEGVGSVAELARLKAADVHMHAARTGVDPADGFTELSEDDRRFHIEKAEGLYRSVFDSVRDDADRVLIAVNAAFGLAAVAETRGDVEAARVEYGLAGSLAESAGYGPLSLVADELLAKLDDGDPPVLYSRADLPRLPFEPELVEESVEDVSVDLPDQPSSDVPEEAVVPPVGPEPEPETDTEDG